MNSVNHLFDTERIELCRRALERSVRDSGEWISGDGRVSEEVAAHLIGIAPDTLANRRYAGTAPPHYRTGRVTYSLADIAEWIEQQRFVI